jgi:uracil-DNA glycosylase family 4
MGAELPEDWRSLAASTLEWWDDAGVGLLVEDAPRDWLAAPAPVQAAPVAVPAGAGMPDEWDAFLAWRTGAAVPEAAWRGARLAATGPLRPNVMVLVDCPDGDDGAAGQLLSGPAGRLFDRMLAAIGLDRAAVHLASVCCTRPVAGRVPRECEDDLSAIAKHHVGLVAPRRLLVMGPAASRAVLATDVQPARGRLHHLNHNSGVTGVVASFHPRFLLDRPEHKAEAWKDLQLLVGGLNE